MTGPLSRLLWRTPLGWLQLRHNRARLAAALAGVAFANILIFMQLGFMGALFETSVMSHRGWNADVVLTSANARSLDDPGTLPRRRLYQALQVEGVADASAVYVDQLGWTDPATDEKVKVRVFGVDPAFPAFTLPAVLDQLPRLALPDTALFDSRSRGAFADFLGRVGRGEPAVFEAAGRRLSIEGLFALGASFTVDGTLITSDQTFLRFFPKASAGAPSLIFVKVAAGADPDVVAARLTAALPESDTRVLTRAAMIDAEIAYQQHKRPIGFVFSFGVVIGVIVGLVIVYQVLTTDVQDHLAEYATLKAMGYGHGWFLGVIFEEALILAALGFLPGLAIALGLYALAGAATGLPITMTWARPLVVLGLTIVMCAASGAIATRRLAEADPADLF
jgi:putative ABC transport system permease protein